MSKNLDEAVKNLNDNLSSISGEARESVSTLATSLIDWVVEQTVPSVARPLGNNPVGPDEQSFKCPHCQNTVYIKK
jgi:hypothetical protein